MGGNPCWDNAFLIENKTKYISLANHLSAWHKLDLVLGEHHAVKQVCQSLQSPLSASKNSRWASLYLPGKSSLLWSGFTVFSVQASGNHKVVVELTAVILGCVIELQSNFAAERWVLFINSVEIGTLVFSLGDVGSHTSGLLAKLWLFDQFDPSLQISFSRQGGEGICQDQAGFVCTSEGDK